MKAQFFKFILCLATVACFCSSCSSGASGDDPIPPQPDPPTPVRIPISLNLGVTAASRVSDTGYEKGDRIGLFVVNYSGGNAGTLAPNGNHVDNMCFTYDGTWTPATPIYWTDDTTPADFYCYYPYNSNVQLTAHPFSVQNDQRTPDAYKNSEFLYGKATKVSPTSNAVNIMTRHLFSCAVIQVAPGPGFTQESLDAADVQVRLNGVKTQAKINLKDGSVTADGEPSSIQPLLDGKQYKALVVPQTAKADNFITVTIDGRDYHLKKEFTFVSGKRHQFTVTVKRTGNGINVGIDDWIDDGTDHGGTAE